MDMQKTKFLQLMKYINWDSKAELKDLKPFFNINLEESHLEPSSCIFLADSCAPVLCFLCYTKPKLADGSMYVISPKQYYLKWLRVCTGKHTQNTQYFTTGTKTMLYCWKNESNTKKNKKNYFWRKGDCKLYCRSIILLSNKVLIHLRMFHFFLFSLHISLRSVVVTRPPWCRAALSTTHHRWQESVRPSQEGKNLRTGGKPRFDSWRGYIFLLTCTTSERDQIFKYWNIVLIQ